LDAAGLLTFLAREVVILMPSSTRAMSTVLALARPRG
jgi:hypothetical protein